MSRIERLERRYKLKNGMNLMIFPYYLLQQRDNPFLIKQKATMPIFSLNVSILKKKVADKFDKTSI